MQQRIIHLWSLSTGGKNSSIVKENISKEKSKTEREEEQGCLCLALRGIQKHLRQYSCARKVRS